MAINAKATKVKTDTRHDIPNPFLRNGEGVWIGDSGSCEIQKLNDTRLINAIVKLNRNVQCKKLLGQNEREEIFLSEQEVKDIKESIDQKVLAQAEILPEMLIEAEKRGLLSRIFE